SLGTVTKNQGASPCQAQSGVVNRNVMPNRVAATDDWATESAGVVAAQVLAERAGRIRAAAHRQQPLGERPDHGIAVPVRLFVCEQRLLAFGVEVFVGMRGFRGAGGTRLAQHRVVHGPLPQECTLAYL